jgi:uracil-DNA glycosylase
MASAHDTIKLHDEWKEALAEEFGKPYMAELKQFLAEEARKGKVIYPRGSDIFAALNKTPLSKVRVVILGQDPYHGPGQAHGLSFSVPPGVQPPPSLQNIFKELAADLGVPAPKAGCLEKWAEQGVLLLNTVLTVERAQAASHRGKGWEKFTDKVIEVLAKQKQPIVFLLWGSFAHEKAKMIPSPPHLILKSVHPSPLSAYRGFIGSRPFSKANQFLEKHQRGAIDWSI